MIKVTVCTAIKESDWGHLSICISLHVFGGGGEKWGMKDEKIIIGEGVLGGGGGKAPQKPERFDARKGNGNHICDPTPMDS